MSDPTPDPDRPGYEHLDGPQRAVIPTLLVLRNLDCGHVIGLGGHRDILLDMQSQLVAAGRRDFRIQTVGSHAEALDSIRSVAEANSCPICYDPLGKLAQP